MLLSIVIPYFNAGKYIYTAVQSILDACIQDAPYEIIIINDASDAANTARLHEIYQRCWASHSEVPVRIETLPENQGLSGGRLPIGSLPCKPRNIFISPPPFIFFIIFCA